MIDANSATWLAISRVMARQEAGAMALLRERGTDHAETERARAVLDVVEEIRRLADPPQENNEHGFSYPS